MRKQQGRDMRKIIITSLFFTLPSAALAGIYSTGGWTPYLTSDFGLTYTDAKLHGYDMSGFTGVFNIGAGVRNNRTRLALTYQKRDTISELFSSAITRTDASLDEQSVMLRAYYDIISGRFISVYVGAAAGVNQYDFKLTHADTRPDYTESGYGFIGGASAGITIHIAHIGFTIGADYNYTTRPRSETITPRIGLSMAF